MRGKIMSEETNGVCPKCGGTEVDPCVGYFRNESGEIEGYDVDPSCAKCGYPWGDDWYQSLHRKASKE